MKGDEYRSASKLCGISCRRNVNKTENETIIKTTTTVLSPILSNLVMNDISKESKN